MADLALLTQLPQVQRAVMASLDGALVEAVGDADAEGLAGVSAFLVVTLADAGEQFGLGALRWISIAGTTQALILALDDDAVITGYVDPPKSLAVVEKALDAALGRT